MLWGPGPPDSGTATMNGEIATTRLQTAARRIQGGSRTITDWKEFQSAWNDAGCMPRLMVDGVVRQNVIRALETVSEHSLFQGEAIMDPWQPNSYGWQSGNQGTFESYGNTPSILLPVQTADGSSTPAQTFPQDPYAETNSNPGEVASMNGEHDELASDRVPR